MHGCETSRQTSSQALGPHASIAACRTSHRATTVYLVMPAITLCPRGRRLMLRTCSHVVWSPPSSPPAHLPCMGVNGPLRAPGPIVAHDCRPGSPAGSFLVALFALLVVPSRESTARNRALKRSASPCAVSSSPRSRSELLLLLLHSRTRLTAEEDLFPA